MSETVVIDRRFCGPPQSANGGYMCGTVAALVGNPAVDTLRQPPPLDTPLRVERDGETARVFDGDLLVAEGSTTSGVDLEAPSAVSFDEATAAAAGSWIRSTPERHAFPTCFVCGPGREAGDGLRVFVGPLEGQTGLHAAPWVPDASLAADGVVAPVFVWAVLDCAGGIAALFSSENPHVLGRMAGDVRRPVTAGDEYVAMGWLVGAEDRKLEAGSCVFDAAGNIVGLARATWIRLR
jgi:hypothetical protein